MKRRCPRCDGTGKKDCGACGTPSARACNRCNGRGTIQRLITGAPKRAVIYLWDHYGEWQEMGVRETIEWLVSQGVYSFRTEKILAETGIESAMTLCRRWREEDACASAADMAKKDA